MRRALGSGPVARWGESRLSLAGPARIAGPLPKRLKPLAALLMATALAGCSSNRVVVRQGSSPAPEPRPLPDALAERDPSVLGDFLEHSVLRPGLHTFNLPFTLKRWVGYRTEAYNVTAEDDVSDRAWFVHRNARHRMSPEAVAGGPMPGGAPDTSEALTIIRAKAVGITPGFTIRDRNGAVFQVKFDPPGYPEMSSAAEVISGRLFHAAGYHVPATYIVALDPLKLEVAPDVTYLDKLGREHPFTQQRVNELLGRVARLPDGRVRAVASRFLEGTNIGPFSFDGTRRDDPADTIPHQHRRELRGLYVMAAWLNHVDIRQHNTLDMVVEENGRRFVRHHLIDFGASLGSGSIQPNFPRDGVEHDVDLTDIFARILTANIYSTRWERYDGGVKYPSVGFYTSDLFDPGSWTADYPNPAFYERTARDGYWGAKLVGSFSEEQIRAAVAAGQLSDPAAAEYLTGEILKRQEMTLRYWFLRATPLEELAVAGGPDAPSLSFRDLAAAHGYVRAGERAYEVRFEFPAVHLKSRETARLRLDANGRGRLELPFPAGADREFWDELRRRPARKRIAKLEVKAIPGPGDPGARSVRIYLLPSRKTGYRIVGRAY